MDSSAFASRPTRDEVLIRQAQIVAERSTCSRGHVGVVIAHDSRVVAQGYNGAPAGMPHCVHACNCPMGVVQPCTCPPVTGERLAGFHWDDCPKGIQEKLVVHDPECWSLTDDGCRISVHAEANAIAFAAKHGVGTNGAALFTTLSPCLACSQLIINAGIVRVVYVNEYRDNSGVRLLRDACVRVWSIAGREIVEHE